MLVFRYTVTFSVLSVSHSDHSVENQQTTDQGLRCACVRYYPVLNLGLSYNNAYTYSL